jgi:outer membrane protein OmpA-like peptidoglycan-associated protein
MNHGRIYSWFLVPLLCGCHALSTSHSQSSGNSSNISFPAKTVIGFEWNKTELSAAAKEMLRAAVLTLNSHPRAKMRVIGHSSSDEADHAALSHSRAIRVAGFMINNDEADPARMSVTSMTGLIDTPIVEVILDQAPAAGFPGSK